LGIGWAYWEFAAGFGIYDPANKRFALDLTKALLPNTAVR
jgi:endoglucanase